MNMAPPPSSLCTFKVERMTEELFRSLFDSLCCRQSGQANFCRKYTNRKSANSWAHSAIANLQISLLCQSAIRKSASVYD
jgi:hypothetical protein